METRITRAGEQPEGTEGRAVVLSVAAVLILQQADPLSWDLSTASASSIDSPDSIQLVLAGYTYPLQRASKKKYVDTEEKSKQAAELERMHILLRDRDRLKIMCQETEVFIIVNVTLALGLLVG